MFEEGTEVEDDYLDVINRSEDSSSSNESITSPAPLVTRPTLASRSTSLRATSTWAPALDATSLQQASTFTHPHRSIFSSGLPTASVSASTAHASMSSPQLASSVHPLSTLSSPSTRNQTLRTPNSSARIMSHDERSSPSIPRRSRSNQIQKHTDDPSAPLEDDSSYKRTGNRPTSLAMSSLFTTTGRNPSFTQTPTISSYTRTLDDSAMTLPSHLYSRGLLGGRHSDITVRCFGQEYALHRLLLDRAPFFCSALSEPWFESTAKEITLHPEDIDASITQEAFELALRRIYGCADTEEEGKHAIGLFATGCWLEMNDLIETSIMSILNQMSPANVADCIRFVTSNYYGKYGERILSAAKTMLCREGYEMLLQNFNGISGELIREILSSDAFYVPGEWERWLLAKRLFNRRLKVAAASLGLIDSEGKLKIARPKVPPTLFREHILYESENKAMEVWAQVYADPEMVPFYKLFDTGIHYMHMTFEQLQRVKNEKDILGMLPLVTESVLSQALWATMELRQRIINANEADIELGLALEEVQSRSNYEAEESAEANISSATPLDGDSETETERCEARPDVAADVEDVKYWVPISDATYQMGNAAEPTIDTPSSKNRSRRTVSTDNGNSTEAGVLITDVTENLPAVTLSPNLDSLYSQFPPFRFSAEFPPTKSLKENRRIYSTTVWYAGSLWNVYVQRKENSKNTQLGIYLHREKHVEGAEDYMRNLAHNLNVDDRITSIERELYLRKGQGRNRPNSNIGRSMAETTDLYPENVRSRIPPDLDTISGLVRPRSTISKSIDLALNSGSEPPLNTIGAFSDEVEETDNFDRTIRKPALPPYFDARPTIKTYFKIYAPSRGGRVMSVYESAPDQFNFSQSWGWKSSNLVIDDDNSEIGEHGNSPKEPRLRFMVVIGNV